MEICMKIERGEKNYEHIIYNLQISIKTRFIISMYNFTNNKFLFQSTRFDTCCMYIDYLSQEI